jgi:hypothetical protein
MTISQNRIIAFIEKEYQRVLESGETKTESKVLLNLANEFLGKGKRTKLGTITRKIKERHANAKV